MGKGKYLRYYETDEQYQEERIDNYFEPWVSVTDEIDGEIIKRVNYNKSIHEKMLGTPLTFEIISGGTLYWRTSRTGNTKTIEYKKNDADWVSITSSQDNDGSGTTICEVAPGDIVQFRGNNGIYGTSETNQTFRNTENLYYYAYGNVMSLISSESFQSAVLSDYVFRYLFENSNIMSHPVNELVLPAGLLKRSCYQCMFKGCTSLVKAPELPTTTLADSCYWGMFSGCTSLIKAPELPATRLPMEPYQSMFRGCTSLTTAPSILPASSLTQGCYYYMFFGCTSLTTAPELPAISPVSDSGVRCCEAMFQGCTSLINIPALILNGGNTFATYCNMFNGCTSLTGCSVTCTVPTLSRSTMEQMFYGCTSLVDAYIDLESTTVGESTYSGMFYGCTNLNPTTKPIIATTSWWHGSGYRMFMNCTSLTNAPDITALSLNNWGCLYSMFQNCTSLTAINFDLQAENIPTNALNGMFYNDTNLVSIPSFDMSSIKTIGENGCRSMFQNCSKLEISPNLNVSTLTNRDCFNATFKNCTSISAISVTCTSPIATDYCFNQTFIDCTNIQNAYINLASETVKSYSYQYMFKNCSKLDCSVKPIISISSADGSECCYQMFVNCFSLTKSPDLNITNIKSGSSNQFLSMFQNCSSLTSCSITCTAPIITNGCFYQTFINCTNIQNAHIDLETETVKGDGCRCMFKNCTNLDCSVKPIVSAVSFNGGNCCESMFSGCRGLTKTPDLSVTNLSGTTFCYYSMFYNCTSLTTAPELPATTLASNCYGFMFNGCTGLTTAPELPATTLVHYCYERMFQGCTNLNYIKCLATDISASNCITDWVYGVQTNSGTFVKDPNMSSWTTGRNGIPSNWTVQDAS